MPELVAMGLVGGMITFVVVNWNLYIVHRSFQKPEFLTLNHNFLKVDRYWSIEQGRVVKVESPRTQDDCKKKDYQKATRSAFLFGTMMIFLSWLGLVLFVIYYLSTTKLAKSRLESRLFDSELVKNPQLSQTDVETKLQELENLG
jgi:hypothetical protein